MFLFMHIEIDPDIAQNFEQTDMDMLFGKGSRRTFKRFGTIIPHRIRNSLKVKSSDTHPFLIKSPSESLEESISMAVFATGA